MPLDKVAQVISRQMHNKDVPAELEHHEDVSQLVRTEFPSIHSVRDQRGADPVKEANASSLTKS